MSRLETRFAQLAAENRAGLITYLMAGDPDLPTSLARIRQLPAAGADVIEIGMPFSDPMAEGPTIQAACQRSLQAGTRLDDVLQLVRDVRAEDEQTPLVLMGYFNPIYSYGVERFIATALEAGADGLIVVDLPPEEDEQLCLPARRAGLDFIRLATPTTDAARMPAVLRHASGFLYYISITGITGSAAPEVAEVHAETARLAQGTTLPIAVGFGISTAEQACEMASNPSVAAVVVGSVLVRTAQEQGDTAMLDLVRALAGGVRQAHR